MTGGARVGWAPREGWDGGPLSEFVPDFPPREYQKVKEVLQKLEEQKEQGEHLPAVVHDREVERRVLLLHHRLQQVDHRPCQSG